VTPDYLPECPTCGGTITEEQFGQITVECRHCDGRHRITEVAR